MNGIEVIDGRNFFGGILAGIGSHLVPKFFIQMVWVRQ